MSRLISKNVISSMALLLCFFTTLVQANTAKHKILVLGDSLSAGYGIDIEKAWVSLLANKWKADGTLLINASISGNTSEQGLNRLPALLKQYKPDHVIIELGGNDGLQGKSIKNLQTNLTKMISLVKSAQAKAILFEIKIPPNYGKRYTSAFTQTYHTVSKQTQVVLIPFFLEDIAYNADLMQRDGIHPKAEAQQQISDLVEQQLTPFIK